MQHAGFLLGINVGKRTVKMAELKGVMEGMGYRDVKTALASGNVVFEAGKEKPEAVVKKLESALAKKFGFEIGVIVRSMEEIEKMLAAKPFKNVKVTPNTRRYVTFLAAPPASLAALKSEYAGYKVLKVTKGEVYHVLELNPKVKTPDVMKLLGKAYGKKITTRNWNTIEKIVLLK